MKADLHIHTDHSPDGVSSVAEMLESARSLGMECIAITDHNTMAGYHEAKPHADGLILVPAMEVSSADGHILAYGLDKEVTAGMSVRDTVAAIHAAGGIAVAAHPYRTWSGLGESNVIEDFDAVEVLNGRSAEKGNRSALQLARRMGKPGTGGSDAHKVEQMGDAYSILPSDCRDADDVINAIKQGKVSTAGGSRTAMGTLRYVYKAVSEWIGRGFRRM